MWKTPRTFAIASAALVAGLLVGAAVVPAVAAQDPVLTPEQQSTLQSQIDAHKACLQQQGVTLPEKSADGSRPELTDDERQAIRAALEACASTRPTKPELSDEQRAQLQAQMDEHRECIAAELSAAGISLPEKPAPGTESADGRRLHRPALTDEQKAAFEAARSACEDLRPNLGVEGIGPFGHGFGPRGHHGPGRFGGPGGASTATQATTTAV
jgi:hypothetical protein